MKKKIYGYQNVSRGGWWFSEHLTLSDQGGQALEIEVEIPDWLNPYESKYGDTCFVIGSMPYSLDEILVSNRYGTPGLCLPDKYGGRIFNLKKLSENWVSRAKYL